MGQVNRGIIIIFKDKTSTRDIEEFVTETMETEMVESIGFFPNDVEKLQERHGRLTSSDGFLKKYIKRLRGDEEI